MSQDDEAARKSRAESLRKRITDLKNEQDEAAEGDEEKSEASDSQGKARSGGSPREFIHKRMRELDKEEKEKDE
jgi:hypothetical protein